MGGNVEESVVAKSTAQQEEKDIALKDAALYNVLSSKKKMTKDNAGYKELEKIETTQTKNYNNQACIKCKFNLPDEKKCHIVEGVVFLIGFEQNYILYICNKNQLNLLLLIFIH